MKLKRQKKGFTIVELVIVVAVIAVLSAVLIPTFVGLVNKAHVTADGTLVRELNNALAMDKELGNEHKTMSQALEATEKNGFTLQRIKSKTTSNKILWDEVNDVFCYVTEDGVEYIPEAPQKQNSVDYQLWLVSNEIDSTYSTYLYNYTLPANKTVAAVNGCGLDLSEVEGATKVTYSGDSTHEVTIVTNGGTLEVNAPNGTVKHYGFADEVNIEAVKTSSYHENGTVPFVEIAKGRIVLEETAKVSHIHFDKSTESSFDIIKVANLSNKEMPEFSRDPVTISGSVLVVEVEKTNASEYIWLEGNGTIEDSKVLVSSTVDGAKTAVTENTAKDYVKQVANTKVGDNVVEGGKTAEVIETIKENLLEEYYSTEFVPEGIPANAVSYIYNRQTKELQTFNTLEEAYAGAANGETIVVCKDLTLDSVFEISDKSINIVGQNNMKPVITGDIYIHHTSGNHNVKLSNLKFIKTTTTQRDNIKDKSVCSSADDANNLTIENCDFDTSAPNSESAVIAVYPTNGITGTALVFKNNIVKTTLGGSYKVAVCTGCSLENNKTDPASHKINIVQPIIDGNTIIFTGNSANNYGFIGSSALITNNTFEGMKSRAFQIYGVLPTENSEGELDIKVVGNTFKNLPEIFKLYKASELAGKENANFDISINTYQNVDKLGTCDGTAGAYSILIVSSMKGFNYTGITNPNVVVTLAKVELTKYGNIENDYMTLPNGKQVMTYTQPIAPQGGRTGFYIEVNNTRLWYFGDKSDNLHYFIDDENNVYVVRLVAGGNTTLSNCVFANATELDPTSYTDADNGKIYNASFTINTFDGNTLYNASAEQTGNKVTVSALAGKTAADINLFISNIGNKTKLLITSNADATADSDTLIYVLPGAVGQINTYGNWTVTIDADIVNYQTTNRQTITVNAGKTVSGSLTVSEAAAKETTITNNGSIRRVNINTKATLTNNGTISSVYVVNVDVRASVVVTEYAKNAYESVITNNGTINFVGSCTKITLTNAENANIGSLWMHVAADNEDAYGYALDSVVVNNGTMCGMNGRNIDIYVRCSFTNNGVIGAEGRGTEGEHAQSTCENYGGVIYLGNYAFGSHHNGLVFINNGTIYAGARHNGNSHQQVTFWVCGAKNATVSITVSGTGTISGNNWKTTVGSPLVVTGITFNNNMGN